MSWIATAENAAAHEIATVAVVPYDFRLDAHIGRLDPARLRGHFIFLRHGIIFVELLPIVRSFAWQT